MSLEIQLRDLARDVAIEAGELAVRRRSEGVSIAESKSSVADIVTEADREVETLIRGLLLAARPGDGFLGEESGHEEGTTDVAWVVDPIDGTVNYAYGIPQYAVSIAAARGGTDPLAWTAIAGAVRHPAFDETFSAARGEGAVLDSLDGSTRLAVNTEFPAGALLATGFGYDKATHDADIDTVRRVMPIARDVRRAGAAALDFAHVAAGRLDGYFERGLKPWDRAAGALIVQEAGGRILDLPADRHGRIMTIAGDAELVSRIGDRVSGITADE
ncbi:inositol monophosphatase family protein [Microbacterium amylolyticum]|uniref:Inositol-1-monophosphatase n=1 Tax=Microbacterium amylolyticum TaxID=936337 RepID=A0ABS4ZIU2_9MICO|nr:inositol monophosphatase family protein [Microbacterium amylolyticum]MBP2437117.1 myo-inositol-1(or 4)-monophosphatase [Microbacterium amylolyticum]